VLTSNTKCDLSGNLSKFWIIKAIENEKAMIEIDILT
jgi:hypothetical protein